MVPYDQNLGNTSWDIWSKALALEALALQSWFSDFCASAFGLELNPWWKFWIFITEVLASHLAKLMSWIGQPVTWTQDDFLWVMSYHDVLWRSWYVIRYDICLFIFFHVYVLLPKLFSFQGDFRFVLCCLPFEIAMFLSLHFLMAPPHEAWLKPWSQNASELQKVSVFSSPRRTKSTGRVGCQAYGAFHHHSMRSLLCFNNVVLVRLFSNASIYCSWQGR